MSKNKAKLSNDEKVKKAKQLIKELKGLELGDEEMESIAGGTVMIEPTCNLKEHIILEPKPFPPIFGSSPDTPVTDYPAKPSRK